MNKLLIVLTVVALAGCTERVPMSTITKAVMYCSDKLGVNYLDVFTYPLVRCMDGTRSGDLTLWNPIDE